MMAATGPAGARFHRERQTAMQFIEMSGKVLKRIVSSEELHPEELDRVGVSDGTVRWHLRHVYHKLHVRSRTEAVLAYLQK